MRHFSFTSLIIYNMHYQYFFMLLWLYDDLWTLIFLMEWNKIKLDILLELELTQLSVSGPTATTRCSGRGTTTGSRTSSTSWQPTACSTPRWGVRHVRLHNQLFILIQIHIEASPETDLHCAAGRLLPGHVPDRGPAADVPQLRGGRLLGAESADVLPQVQYARILHPRLS